jgi:hypothetical protein
MDNRSSMASDIDVGSSYTNYDKNYDRTYVKGYKNRYWIFILVIVILAIAGVIIFLFNRPTDTSTSTSMAGTAGSRSRTGLGAAAPIGDGQLSAPAPPTTPFAIQGAQGAANGQNWSAITGPGVIVDTTTGASVFIGTPPPAITTVTGDIWTYDKDAKELSITVDNQKRCLCLIGAEGSNNSSITNSRAILLNSCCGGVFPRSVNIGITGTSPIFLSNEMIYETQYPKSWCFDNFDICAYFNPMDTGTESLTLFFDTYPIFNQERTSAWNNITTT